MKELKIGDKCRITTDAKRWVRVHEDVEFTIKDILQQDVSFPIVLTAEEFGEDWYEFFKREEIILI